MQSIRFPIRVNLLAVLIALIVAPAAQPAPIPEGSSKIEVDVGTRKLDVFTYKPKNFNGGPLIVIFHGTNRNADEYRDFGKGLADRIGALVVAPLFDNKQFSSDAYHNGGMIIKGKLLPSDEWTGNMTPKIAAEVRRLEGRPRMPYYFFGHSAGGQFLSRISGFVFPGAVRIVAANPGAHLFPTRDLPYPYGFGKLPKELSDDDAIQLYLAQPLTIFVGTADTGKAQLPMGETAMKQGPNRYERGKNCFKMGKELAEQKGWTFNWRLVEAAGVAHDGKGMLDHANSVEALFGITARKLEPANR
jgi:poly(3-hydroxybutyrate) depolymerase